MEADLGLDGLGLIYSWVEGKGLHVTRVCVAGWSYGGLPFFIFFIFFIFLSFLSFLTSISNEISWKSKELDGIQRKSKEF